MSLTCRAKKGRLAHGSIQPCCGGVSGLTSLATSFSINRNLSEWGVVGYGEGGYNLAGFFRCRWMERMSVGGYRLPLYVFMGSRSPEIIGEANCSLPYAVDAKSIISDTR